MGVDITSVVEIYGEHTKRWSWHSGALFPENIEWGCNDLWEPFPIRYYFLFGVLAGVRDHDVMPISQPRGLPDDISSEALDILGGLSPCNGAHSEATCTPACEVWGHSWLDGMDILGYDYTQGIIGESEIRVGDELGDWFQRLLDITEIMPHPRHVRVVFHFNN